MRQVRILVWVVLRSSKDTGVAQAATDLLHRRGWRNFIAAAKVTSRAEIVIGDLKAPVQIDRGSYIDIRIRDHGLPVRWHRVLIEGAGGALNWAPVCVIDGNQILRIVSGTDDTIPSM